MLAMCAPRRGPMRIVALTVAGLTGFARMYVGAHLPLDIVGGVAIGSLTACLVDGARPNAPGPVTLPGR